MTVELPLSVWPTAQATATSQRTGRYLPACRAHPGKMLPAIAQRAITTYTAPGDLVVDPMCGIGTTLVEAIHLGRSAYGVEYEPAWAQLARANVHHAHGGGAAGDGHVVVGDARRLPDLLDPEVHGRVALVLTSPPYGPVVHGQVIATPGAGVRKSHDRYSVDPANLAHVGLDRLLDAMATLFAQCQVVLRAGGFVAMTVRPYWQAGQLIDLPGRLGRLGEDRGLVLFERNVCLLAGLRDDRIVPRASFFALDQVRRARARGLPRSVVAHEALLVWRRR
ncbi:MAG: TRM11 family SAM-dependent methyltransferase [Trebonia sp.]